jgi:glycosyltransferase involved in cell wall biosynthesis
MATVSVVIDTFNSDRFIVEAIESVLAQTAPPNEVIVVDDGSTDETARILDERYSGHKTVKILHQRNGGQMSAMVRGLEHAEGDVICLLDGDDRYERNHLENVTKVFAEHEGVGYVFTAHRKFGAADEVVQYAPADLDLGFCVVATLKNRVFMGSIMSATAISRQVSQTLLPVLRQVAPRWRLRAEDCIVYGASLAGAKKYYLAEPTVLYRIHGSNASQVGQMKNFDEYFAHGQRRDTAFELFCRHLGLGPTVRMRVVLEFLSIRQPTRNQYRAYVKLNWQVHESLWQCLKGRIKIYLHYKRNRPAWDRRTPAEFHG